MSTQTINYKTQLVLANSNTVLSFGTPAAKRAYVKMLKTKGAVEVDIPQPVSPEPEVQVMEPNPEPTKGWEMPEETLNALRDIGWLRDKAPVKVEAGEEEEPVMESALSPDLLPMGYTESAVLFNKDGELMQCSMPTVMHSILGYLALASEGDAETKLTSIKKLTAGEAGKEFRYGNWIGADLIGAITQAYQWVLESNEEVLKELLSTGKDVLQYQTSQDHEDIVLGMAKSGKEWKGNNLIGHVLMSLRGLYGGEPDPRIELIRGYREYTVEECTPGGEGFDKVKEAVAEIQAKLLYGDTPSANDAEEVTQYNEGVGALKGFILEQEWWPFPLFDELVLIEDMKSPAALGTPECLLNWFITLSDLGVMQFIGAEKSPFGGNLVTPVKEIDLGDKVIPCRPYDKHADALFVHIDTANAADWWTWYLSEQSAKLSASQLVRLFSILAKNRLSSVQWTVDNTQVHFSSGSEVYTWNFQFRSVEARQTRKAFKHIILNDKPTSSNYVLLWLALRALDGFKGLNQTLASLANLWEREANYGHAWEDDHPTRRVRDNSWAPLKMKADFLLAHNLKVENGVFNFELFLKLVSTPACRHDAYVDKNGMKVLAGNGAGAASMTSISYPEIALEAFDALDAGVNPLLVLSMVLPKDELFQATVEILSGVPATLIVMKKYGIFHTLNDGAKMPKFLNRAQQGASWNEAYCEVFFEGEVIKRSASMMTVVFNYNPTWVKATQADVEGLLAELFPS